MPRELPRYTWDDRVGQFRGPGGRFLRPGLIREALDDFIAATGEQLRTLSEGLRAGTTSLQEWEAGMRRAIKDTQLYSATLARGGWEQLSPADFGLVGNRVRAQYAYLRNFVEQISGGLPLDGIFLNRATWYAEAARPAFYALTEGEKLKRGFTHERNVLHPAEHCDACIAEAERLWVPIGTLIPLGARTCRALDKCSIEYAKF